MRKGVLVVGSINMDLVIRAERMPRPGETLFGSGFECCPGGKGANQAVSAARLGAPTAICGRLGRDPFAGPLRENLERAGVDTSLVRHDPETASGVALIAVQPDGENSILVASGSNMKMRTEDLEAARPWFERSAVVLLQFEAPLNVVERALDMAKETGCRSVLDPAPAVKAPPELLGKADVLSPNESEAEALLGMSVGDDHSAQKAARRLRDMGAGRIILKLGGRGALLYDGARQEFVPGFDVDPVDTTAAGDAFTGAIGVAISEGMEWVAAVRFANGAGAMACLGMGAQTSLPTREELEAFLQTAVERNP